MNKRWVQALMLVALALCVSLLPAGALGDAEGENLLANAGFEELDGTGVPVGWAKSMYNWDDGVTAFDVVTGTAHTGNVCVRVRSLGENDARYEQTVACEPNTVYRLSGWVRVEDVPEGTMGANLSVEDAFSSTNSVTGTSAEGEWTYMELYGITGPEQTSLTVMARLGFYGSTITGTAWFDDIALEHVHEIPDGVLFGYLYQDTGDSGAAEVEVRDYTAYLIALALAFALVVLALLMLRNRQRLPSLAAEGHEQAVLWAMLAVAFVARLALAAFVPGYPNDIACWQGWGARVIEEGTWGFYESGWCDYPPGYLYVLGALDALRTLVGVQYNTVLSQVTVKLPAMLCDLAGALLLYRWARREGAQGGMALWLAALYAFNPLTICDSAAWGQIDSVFTLMVAVAVYFCAKGRWTVALPVYVVSALVKPQTLMLAPMALVVLIAELVRASRGGELGRTLKQVGIGLAISLAAAVVIVAPFWGGQSWDWLVSKYVGTMASYSYATVNALNLYAIAGLNWAAVSATIAGIPAEYLGYAFMALSVAYCAFLYIRARDRRAMPLTCALMIMLLFCFGTMMHERYAFPALLLMLLGYVLLWDRRLLTAAAIMSALQFMNVALVLQSEHLQSSQWLINDIVALGNIAVTVYVCVFAFDICVRGHIRAFGAAGSPRRARIAPEGFPSVREDMMRRLTGRSEYRLGMKALDWAIVGALTAAYAVLAFTNLGTLSAPQTEWRSTMPGETVTIDLGEERTFDFTYYGGICDSAFTVEFSSDGVTWSEPGQAEYSQGKIFQWLWYRETMRTEDGTYVALVNGYPRNTARYVRLTFASAGFKMREIGFLDEAGECYPIASISSANGDIEVSDDPHKMIDEQDTVPAKPSYYNSMYFDEIYHARTAYEHLNGLHTYEWTHPPLGKVLMMIGIAIFGMCPFGWRFMGALMGVLMVPAMYLLTQQLFKRRNLAIFTTVLLTVDCMHFTQTRLATIDSYGVFFIMVMYLFMFRYMQMSFFRDGLKRTLVPLGLSGLFMGIGCACKWIDIYAAAGLAVLFFATMYMRFSEYRFACAELKRAKRMSDELKPYAFARDHFARYLVTTLLLCCVFFIAVPLAIYYLSYYWQLAPDGNFSVKGVIDVQKSMLSYHSGLTNDDHPFRAEWYTWPLMLKPMYYYSGREFAQAGTYSIIWCLGNPAVWLTMLAGMIFTLVMCIKEKLRDREKLTVIVSLLAQYLPWVLVPRSMYIYHYFASIPFMIMSICFAAKHFGRAYPRATRVIAIAIMLLAAMLFALFYPAISGAPCSQAQLDLINLFLPKDLY